MIHYLAVKLFRIVRRPVLADGRHSAAAEPDQRNSLHTCQLRQRKVSGHHFSRSSQRNVFQPNDDVITGIIVGME